MIKPLNISFRNVSTFNEAKSLVQLLASENITAKLVKDSADLDYVLQGEGPTNKFEILINEADQHDAEKMMMRIAARDLKNVDPSYYLFSFANKELLDVIIEKDEWSEFDVLLSQKILKERGFRLNQRGIRRLQQLRTNELSSPEGNQTGWIVVGYITAFLGGFLGLVIGYFLWQAKKKVPDGHKVYAYDPYTRHQGKIIFIISAIVFPALFLGRMVYDVIFFSTQWF